MDLLKTFDGMPYNLLTFDENSLVFIYSYLRGRDQCEKLIKHVFGSYQRILPVFLKALYLHRSSSFT